MSGYILCQTKRAKLPYFIENISTNVYSIEELCYYLYHNLYLIDQTIMNEGLCSWIQEELELPALAAKLQFQISKFASAEDIVYPVFKEINYLTYEELKELNVRLQKMNEETPAMREKQKADALMENEMYVHAIQVYQNLLEREDLEKSVRGDRKSVPQSWLCLQLSVSDGKSYRVFSKSIRGKQEPGGTGSLSDRFWNDKNIFRI